MGASILLVFIIPIAFLEVFFSGISGTLFGYPTAEIALPYDEEKGIVWEYDNVDDPNIELVKTEIRDGEQVFVFESRGTIDLKNAFFVKDKDELQGDLMDLVFTDKNGNQKVYYGYNGYKIYEPVFYSAEECQTIDVTLTAKSPKENASWQVIDSTQYVLMKKSSGEETETFTVIITPTNRKGEYATVGTFDVEFAYTDSDGRYIEKATALFTLHDGTHSLDDITCKSMTGIKLLDFLDTYSVFSGMI